LEKEDYVKDLLEVGLTEVVTNYVLTIEQGKRNLLIEYHKKTMKRSYSEA